MQSEQRELALRTHIRDLLLNYSLTHLATNYVTWTQDTVNELLSRRLSYVPATDPTDLLLPSDTYETLLRIWKLEKIQPYNEILKSDARALQVVKTHLLALNRRERPTVECWNVEEDIDYSQWLMLRPMSPVLSNASIRRTPRPGLLTGLNSTPHNWKEVLRGNNLKAVQSEDLPEEPPPKLQDVLQLRLASDGQTQKDMAALFKSVAALSRRAAAASDIHQEAKAFLRADSPPVELLRMTSPPLFSRDRRPGYNSSSTGTSTTHLGLGDLTDLPAIVSPVTPEDDADEELYKQHMVVVDGWQAYAVPSSPLTPGTPSLADSSSEVDELMLPSSPGHDRPLIEEVIDARLDEYEMPKSRKIGSTQEQPKAVGHGQSLSSFLSPLRRRHGSLQDQARIVTTPKSQPSSPHTAITASMLGQPPTMFDDEGTGDSNFVAYNDLPSEGSDPDTDILLRRIYGEELLVKDAARVVMDEKLDERDCMLMDVPVLPPPNEHAPTAMFLPRAPVELLVAVKQSQAVTTPALSGHLKKAKGMQALNIELSWIPFKYGSSIPTDDEVTGVVGSIGYGLASALQDEDVALGTQLADLLDTALNLETCTNEEDAPSTTRYLSDEYDSANFGSLKGNVGDVDIILTRDERRSVRGKAAYDDVEFGSSDKENEGLACSSPYDPDEKDGPPLKRVRAATLQEEEEAYYDEFDQAAVTADYSCMLMSPSQVASGGCVGGFAELGYGAQGFEGASADGDLFDDIDPIFEIGFVSGVSPVRAGCGVPRHADIRSSDRHTPWVARQDIAARTASPRATPPGNSATINGAELSMPLVDQIAVHDRPYTRTPKTFDVPQEPQIRNAAHLENHRPAMTSGASVELSAALPSARRTLSEFLTLMGKQHVNLSPRSSPPTVAHSNDELPVDPVQEGPRHDCPPSVPADLLDRDVLSLPGSGLRSTTVHRYMASIALLQKRALVRCLASRECCVELVEREDLGDADLIVDPETAVIFASLAALPSQADATLAKLTGLSWRYSHILLVLEAYPDWLSFKHDPASPRVLPYPFSAAVVKAAKKLRRNVNIAKACETMRAGSSITFAYAVSPEEAASYARLFGDETQTRDPTHGALWGNREWLDFDEQEGEVDLGGIDGMNVFAASIILSQMNLDDFLDTSPEDRVQFFGPYVGHDRLVRFNEELAKRARAVQLEPSSPMSIDSRTPA